MSVASHAGSAPWENARDDRLYGKGRDAIGHPEYRARTGETSAHESDHQSRRPNIYYGGTA